MSDDFTSTIVQIPCCLCGVKIDPNPSNMCIDCLRRQEDFGDKIQPINYLNYCSSCGRYQASPTTWINAELDTPELLQLCLKRINGIKEFQINEAKFIWTEPHSKRIKVSLSIEKEIFNGTIIRRTLIIIYKIRNLQCPDCCEAATPRDHWKAIVQLRQHSDENRTIYWLEQQILSHNAHSSATAIERKSDGLDFQFNEKAPAERFVNFVKCFAPIEIKTSNRLAGQDLQCNTYDLRFTYSLKLPMCSRQDLVVAPPHVVEMTGRKSRLLICFSLGKFVSLVDPFCGKIVRVDAKQYWAKPFGPLMTHRQLKRFAIISKEIVAVEEEAAARTKTAKNRNSKSGDDGEAMRPNNRKMSKKANRKAKARENFEESRNNEKQKGCTGGKQRKNDRKNSNKSQAQKGQNQKENQTKNENNTENDIQNSNENQTQNENQNTNENNTEKDIQNSNENNTENENENTNENNTENDIQNSNENNTDNADQIASESSQINNEAEQKSKNDESEKAAEAEADIPDSPDQHPPPRFQIAELELTDEETYSDRILVRTHLGHLLNEGDICLCYDLREAVFPDEVSDSLKKTEFLNGVVVVARTTSSAKKKKKKRARKFTLKKLAPVEDEEGFEAFMDELEQDSEYRNGINLYRNDKRSQSETDDENIDDIDGVLTIIDL